MRCQTSDQRSFEQVFLQLQYAPAADVLLRPRLIVDCGANVGYSALYFLTRFPAVRVVAVEPDPANARVCSDNLAPYADRARLVEAAVWPSQASLRLEHTRPGDEWGIRVAAAADGSVRGVTIAELLRDAREDWIDLLKVDIEGAERQLFSGDLSWLRRVRTVAIELHGEAHGFGPEQAAPFWDALRAFDYDRTQHGEMTLCSNLRPR